MARTVENSPKLPHKWDAKMPLSLSKKAQTVRSLHAKGEYGTFADWVLSSFGKSPESVCPKLRFVFQDQIENSHHRRRCRSACQSPISPKRYSPLNLHTKEDPYKIHQIGRKLERIKIEQKCQKQNRESVTMFYGRLLRGNSVSGKIKQRKVINTKTVKALVGDDKKDFENEMANFEQAQRYETIKQAQLEEIRDTRMDIENFLVTNRQSYVRLKEVRAKQYFTPFDSKDPFLSLNSKLLGKASKFSRLKTYTIITTTNNK